MSEKVNAFEVVEVGKKFAITLDGLFVSEEFETREAAEKELIKLKIGNDALWAEAMNSVNGQPC